MHWGSFVGCRWTRKGGAGRRSGVGVEGDAVVTSKGAPMRRVVQKIESALDAD